ncbi:NAD-dependent epimerase/dehydratase family protein [Mycobacterium sp. NAZ190054]|uniref:NAD-dependent epimerase/dehydratase family protein n=1 Tax=Mycobacterium sp. NAZ190054 TaxID=1747766 RepID=UPI0007936D3C|nr:NAD-dependent epimerase/dehydratase family protein [Mycobacterium sp. NAZ190054]KWX66520.1 UDP-glucose 4-epimerase [Mycobacterium sp. NAZ190054]
MRAIVTGAAGFIGSTLVDRLLVEGHQVVGIDNLSTGLVTNLEHASRRYGPSGRFVFTRVDVRASALNDIVAATRPDVVYHLAAQVDLRASVTDPQHDASCNVLGTINVLEACRLAGVRRIVYAASGGSRYGAPVRLPVTESTAPNPLSPYAAAKYAGEVYLNAYADMYGMVPISLGLANVYGPRQNPHGEAGVIAVFSSRLLTGRPVTVFGDGTASRDYVYVDDVVDAFVRAGRVQSAAPGIYNIGTGQQTTTNEVHRLIAEALGGTPPPCYSPARTGEVQAIALDVTKARSHFGWAPSVDVERGIKHTIHWLRGALEPEPVALADA